MTPFPKGTAAPWIRNPSSWVVGHHDAYPDGLIYSATFEGPDARERALEYGRWKYQELQVFETVEELRAASGPPLD